MDCVKCKEQQDAIGDKPPYQKMMPWAKEHQDVPEKTRWFCPHCDHEEEKRSPIWGWRQKHVSDETPPVAIPFPSEIPRQRFSLLGLWHRYLKG